MLEGRKCPNCGKMYPPMVETCHEESCRNEKKPLLVVNTLLGQVLDQRYRLDQILGYGGMGVVYRATHVKTRRERAVKVLHPEMVEKEGMLRRFQTEAVAASMIKSDKAVEIVDFQVTADNLAYLVMEMVEGSVLRELIPEGGMEPERAVEIICQICEAVHAAHEKKIIHRDLKPDNVIVRRTGVQDFVKVLDFGIAKLRESDQSDVQAPQTKIGTIMGTPQYMSPEQCRGVSSEKLTPASDVYSIGVIAYEMLCGRPPFEGKNALELIDKHKHEPPTHLKHIKSNLPIGLATVVMRGLAKMPEDRWESAEKLAQELRISLREARGGKTLPHQPVVTEVMTGPLWTGQLPSPNQQATVTDPNDPLSRETVPLTKVAQKPAPPPTPAPVPQPNWLKRGLIAAGVLLLVGGGIYWAVTRSKPVTPDIADLPKTINDQYGEMVLIPGGSFKMGNDKGEDDERPAVPRTLPPYYLDKYEVTNQQYKKFVDAKNYQPPEHWESGAYKPGEASYPVTHVTWDDAQAYAQWAGKRLPKEAEWEFAARGGEKEYLFPWGNERGQQANYGTGKLAVRGAYADDVSFFGIFDLAGNVSEWVEDRYFYYNFDRAVSMDSPDDRVLRGGNFAPVKGGGQITNTTRISLRPQVPSDAQAKEVYRKNYFPITGFRCAKDALPTK